jgi:hypothetical protein
MLFRPQERRLAAAISQIAYANPFTPARIEGERLALGDEYSEEASWSAYRAHLDAGRGPESPNVVRLRDRSWRAALEARARLDAARGSIGDADLALYEDLSLYSLFARYEPELYRLAVDESVHGARFASYGDFKRDFERLLVEPGLPFPSALTAAGAIAVFFQIRRAFHYIFRHLLGVSRPIAELRAETWHSVFTHDLRRYQRGLFRHMADIPTLIVGPSGTGKDLVAQAIGYSRHLAFDEAKSRFVAAFSSQFHALSVSALPMGVVESELFGHRRGAFTGALEDRPGWLEVCGPDGSVFLDEIGELGTELQVKFLRVLQARSFQRIGETEPRRFLGKVIAATHRDLDQGLLAGWFREDLYYRLCADRVQTPTLRERLTDNPLELRLLIALLSERIAGLDQGETVAKDALEWVERELGADYAWPGNVRELEQCVRNVMVRKRYRPARRDPQPTSVLDRALLESGLGADALLDRYALLVYRESGNYVEAGRRLELDRRTVRERAERGERGERGER